MNQATLLVADCMIWRPMAKSAAYLFAVDVHVASNAAGGYLDTGDWFLCKEIPGGIFYDADAMYNKLDQMASPGPGQSATPPDQSTANIINPVPEDEDVLPMLRVIGDSKPWPIDGAVWAPHVVRFQVNDSMHAAKGFIACYYFPGPAGGERNLRGEGVYALKLKGNGEAHLFERVTAEGWTSEDAKWKRRMIFRYAPPYAGGQTMHRIIIHCVKASDTFGNLAPNPVCGNSGMIYFDVTGSDQSNLSVGYAARTQAAQAQGSVYFPPTWIVNGKNNVEATQLPIGMDIRQDVLLSVQISQGAV